MQTETLHPLVTVADFSKLPKIHHGRYQFGFYAVMLKDVKCGDLIYGRIYYDYQEGTLVFLSPGQVAGVKDNGDVFQPIQSYLIDVAEERIVSESKSVGEVAYSLGFRYPQHFALLFKRKVGMSPLEYRHSFGL